MIFIPMIQSTYFVLPYNTRVKCVIVIKAQDFVEHWIHGTESHTLAHVGGLDKINQVVLVTGFSSVIFFRLTVME